MGDTAHPVGTRPPHPWRSRIAFWLFAAIAAFYLLIEHRTHALGLLPYLVILLCPLLHLFHHGHGSHDGRGGGDARAHDGHQH